VSKTAALKVQMWGNSLAVRLPSAIARSAKLEPGQPVEISVREGVITIVPAGKREMTLSERLALYDVEVHGGEAMVTKRRGKEVM
jgi:antitoxin MazE